MSTALILVLLLAPPSLAPQRPRVSPCYELRGGWWFDGARFTRKQLYVVTGKFTDKRPQRIDETIDLDDLYIVPPFGDSHTHGFENRADIVKVSAAHLRAGIFYALSLTNSVRAQRRVASQVNKPDSVDVAYAGAGLTASLGHPILSAEVTANKIPWDQLRANWGKLLKSNTAEGDAYFVIDNENDLHAKWPRILATKPDVLKIYLLDTENYEEKKKSRDTIGDKGLDPALVAPIVHRAHRAGLRVAAHVETAADTRVAVRAGVDIIAHLPGAAPKPGEPTSRYVITAADAEAMVRKGITVIPTAWLAERLAAPQPWLTGAEAQGDAAQLARAKQIQRDSLAALRSAGVSVAVGSDLFEDATREALYLNSLGVFSPTELLDLWTRVTPQLIFPRRRIGRLAPGYEASFLALACDPTAKFECVRQIELRLKSGVRLGDGCSVD